MPTRRFIIDRADISNPKPHKYRLICTACGHVFRLTPDVSDTTHGLRCPRCHSDPLAGWLYHLADRVEARIKAWFDLP
jgi:DNA-directed RNA polymerase subunit RPC12/RpoP